MILTCGVKVSGVDESLCSDAIVVIPGIMGTELVEGATGRVIWGLNARACWRMWAQAEGMADLRVTDAEYAGRTGRLIPRRLITAPAFAPWLGGFEPYARLLSGIRKVAPGSGQVLEFPYDWRLSVEFNARRLAREAANHLRQWRRTLPSAQLTLVAHSMGGLLVRALALPDIAAEAQHPLDIGTTITMGTPFYGSVKAAMILGADHSKDPIRARLRNRLREVALTMPGVYDLLPRYRCVSRGRSLNSLSMDDIRAIGANFTLAHEAWEFGDLLSKVGHSKHQAIVGVDQPTYQSLTVDSGVVRGLPYGFRSGTNGELIKERRQGDGTVYRDSADLGIVVPLPQQHGALAKSPEAVAIVRDILTRGDHRGPRLGASEIGIDPPDVVEPGTEWTMEVTGVTSPAAIRCTLTDLAAPWRVASPRLERRNGGVYACVTIPTQGLFRLAITGGSTSPITQIIAAARPRCDIE